MLKGKKEFSKLIVTMIVLLNSLFTIAVLFVFFTVGSEPVALIGSWFAFTTGELWILSSIKKTKYKKINEKGEDYEGFL